MAKTELQEDALRSRGITIVLEYPHVNYPSKFTHAGFLFYLELIPIMSLMYVHAM